MFLMGIGTTLYELKRSDKYSQIFISIILIGIYFLVWFDESYTSHYFFAGSVFLGITLFMIRHVLSSNYNRILVGSLTLAVLLSLIAIITTNRDVLYTEVLYILNFAFYYLYLHFLQSEP